MSNSNAKIKVKNSGVVGAIPSSTFLEAGELALNYADNKLYYKNAADAVTVYGEAAFDTSITGSGKTFADADNGKIFHVTGTNTLVLPAWLSVTSGWSIGIVNTGGATLTINRSSTNTINGTLTTLTNTVAYSAVYIYKSPAAGSFVAIGMLS